MYGQWSQPVWSIDQESCHLFQNRAKAASSSQYNTYSLKTYVHNSDFQSEISAAPHISTLVCAGQLVHVFRHKHGLSPIKRSILSVWNYCTTKYPWIINMVSLLLLQITKVNWVWYICHFFPIQMQRLPFEKDLHHYMVVQEVILSSPAMRRWKCQHV